MDCDGMEIILKDEEFMHSISSEALQNLTDLVPIRLCFRKKELLDEVVKDQTLVDRLTSPKIGSLLQHEEVTTTTYINSKVLLSKSRFMLWKNKFLHSV